MAEETQSTPSETQSTTSAPPPVTTTTTSTPDPGPSRAEVELAALKAQKAAEQSAAAEAAKAAAAAKQAAEVEKVQKRAEAEAARAAKLQAQLRDQKVLSLLPPGLKQPKDNPNLFVSMFTEGIELTDEGGLTDEAVAKIKARAEEHHYLFEGGGAAPGSVGFGGSVRPSGNNWTPEEQSTFEQLGVEPGAYKKSPTYKAFKNTLFKNLGGPLHG